ncbi:MAG: zinc ribbon domain-containing protein [Thermoplasmatota archaeon]
MDGSGIQRFNSPDGKGLPPPTPHLTLLVSVAFCVIGGALILSSSALSWVVEVGSGEVWDPDRVWGIDELLGYSPAYLVIPMTVIGGVTVITLSMTTLLTERRIRRDVLPMATVGSAFLTTAVAAILMVRLGSDLGDLSSGAVCGPAAYLLVFGCVLIMAGGLMLMLQTIQHPRSTQFRGEQVSFRTWRGSTGKREDYQDERDSRCPKCNSPVNSSWRLCPLCGNQLR